MLEAQKVVIQAKQAQNQAKQAAKQKVAPNGR